MTAPELVIVGPPGAGKSTVGRLLADELDLEFRDTDEDIEEAQGKSISDIFVDDGEPYFRVLEAEAVGVALATHDGVLAVGGGAILNSDTRDTLGEHTVVYLAVDVPDAANRVGLNRDRPLLLGNPRAQLRALLEERRPFYEQVATVTVDTNGRSAEQVVDAVLEQLG